MRGWYFFYSKNLNFLEKIYSFIFGIPIIGLRIRLRRMLPIIKKYFNNKNSILDFGSGRGVFSIEMAKLLKSTKIYGIDMNKKKINDATYIANKLGLHNCVFFSEDIFNLEKKYDGILAIDVLEHIKDDLSVVKKIYSILNKNGIFIVHVPHKYRNLFGYKRINFDIEGHVRPGYLMEELIQLFKQAKFKIIDKGYSYSSLETLFNDISYLITRGSEKNKILYSLVFPILLIFSYPGKFIKPKYGSGVYIVARKEENYN